MAAVAVQNFIVVNDLGGFDYQVMSMIRSQIIRTELQTIAFHPNRVIKWINYYCENGGEIINFDWDQV